MTKIPDYLPDTITVSELAEAIGAVHRETGAPRHITVEDVLEAVYDLLDAIEVTRKVNREKPATPDPED